MILVPNLATTFQDLVAKVKNLVALAPVLGAISRPAMYSDSLCISETGINSGKTLSNFSVCWFVLSERDCMRPDTRQ